MSKKKYKNFADFVKKLGYDYREFSVSPDGGGFELISLDTSAIEFLLQAEADFEKGEASLYLNCITNSKRAILCQMDEILTSFGFNSLKWNVVRKMKYLNELGVLTPLVLRKVAKIRNILEHNYTKPTIEEVELALDVAHLFVLSNKALFSPFAGDMTFRVYPNDINTVVANEFLGLYLGLIRENKEVYWQIHAHKEGKCIERYQVFNTDPIFCPLVKLCTSFQLDYKIKDALVLFDSFFEDSSSSGIGAN